MSSLQILEETSEYIKYTTFLIFTDGSALNNSQDSKAGWAVYMPSVHKLFSKSMIGTNNQAELEAIRFALWYVIENFDKLRELFVDNEIVIKSDSKYSIDVVTGAKNSKLNVDRITQCKEFIETISNKGININFVHVNAHTNKKDFDSRCNDLVDKAAREKASE